MLVPDVAVCARHGRACAPVARVDATAARSSRTTLTSSSHRHVRRWTPGRAAWRVTVVVVVAEREDARCLACSTAAITSPRACRQDLDNFEEWWQPQLSTAGYDSVFAKCDDGRREG